MTFPEWPVRSPQHLWALVVTACLYSVTGVSMAANSEEAAWRQTVRAFAADNFKNPAWGYSHSVRDYELARQLAASDHVVVDDDVLFAAAYLHDMAAFAPWEIQGKDHGDVGATTIDLVLKATDFPLNKIEAVRNAIRTHMYDRSPVGPEATYLHDADALDWLGAIGIARVLALAGSHGPVATAHDAIGLIERNTKDVPNHVMSPAGRARIATRLAEDADFLRGLREESNNLESL